MGANAETLMMTTVSRHSDDKLFQVGVKTLFAGVIAQVRLGQKLQVLGEMFFHGLSISGKLFQLHVSWEELTLIITLRPSRLSYL
jgi:hypothetical protein